MMTYNEVINIARRLDKETQEKIDKEVEERLEILREGDLNNEDMEKMEECLYMSLVIQEYLDSEFELLEEEKMLLLAEMEELYNEYGDLLTKAKLEEKVSKKKRMALELMRIREQLFERKDRMQDVNKDIKTNRDNNDKLAELSSKDNMKKIAEETKTQNVDKVKDNKNVSKKALDVNGEELKPHKAGVLGNDIVRDTDKKIRVDTTSQVNHNIDRKDPVSQNNTNGGEKGKTPQEIHQEKKNKDVEKIVTKPSSSAVDQAVQNTSKTVNEVKDKSPENNKQMNNINTLLDMNNL